MRAIVDDQVSMQTSRGSVPADPSATLVLRHDHRIAYLDGLRGLAVLFVVFSHASNEGFNVIPFVNAEGAGKIGVWLFFVLSSYLLFKRLRADIEAEKGLPLSLRSYAIRRIFRIFPLYLMILIADVLLGTFTPHEALRHGLLLEGKDHLWAIPVEMKSYLFLPVFVLIFVFIPSRRLSLAIIGSILMGTTVAYYLRLLPGGAIAIWPFLLVFGIGVMAASMEDLIRQAASRISATTVVTVMLAIVVAFAPVALEWISSTLSFPVPSDRSSYPFRYFIGMVWAVVIVAVPLSKRWLELFSHRSIVLVGKISFSVYLVHWLLLYYVIKDLPVETIFKGPLLLLLSLAASFFTFKLIEQPGMAMGEWLVRRMR